MKKDRWIRILAWVLPMVLAGVIWIEIYDKPMDRPDANEVEGEAPYRVNREAVEVFRRAFWRNPSAADEILHAERREWRDDGETVSQWQWFLQVRPGRRLLEDLRSGAIFTLQPATGAIEWATLSSAPTWFPEHASGEAYEIWRDPSGQLTFLYDADDNLLFGTDEGFGFAAATDRL